MALVLNNERKSTSDAFSEVIKGLESGSISYEPLFNKWLEAIEPIAKHTELFKEWIPPLKKCVDDLRKNVSPETVDSFSWQYRRISPRIDTPIWDISYCLFYNIDSNTLSFEGISDKTIFIGNDEWSFVSSKLQSKLGKAIINYITDANDSNKTLMLNELAKRALRRIKSEYMNYIKSDITNSMDVFDNFRVGRILGTDIGYPKQPYQFKALSIGKTNAYIAEGIPEEKAIRIAYEEVVELSNGDFRLVSDLEHTDDLLLIFTERYGYEGIDQFFFYTRDGSRKVPNKRYVKSILEVMPDVYYSEHLSFMIKVLSYNPDVEGLANVVPGRFIPTLAIFLRDERAEELIEKWGGIYSSRKFSNCTVINSTLTVEEFLRTPHYNFSDDYAQYVVDSEYNGIQSVIKEMTNLGTIEQEIVDSYKKSFDTLSRYSELLEGNDFLPEDLGILDNKHNVFYCPGLSNGTLIDTINRREE